MPEAFVWTGILVCLVHSGMFSGLNLALLGPSRLRLEVQSRSGDSHAARVLELRRDANLLLATILWGNVAVNCLLTLLSDSVLAGVSAFAFSTLGITLLGEIGPQAYFSRNAIAIGGTLAPVIRVYETLLWPLARPTAWALDRLVGPEGPSYFRERDLRELISQHVQADDSEIDLLEGRGALNFLDLDDLLVREEGHALHPDSVLSLPSNLDLPLIPDFEPSPGDPFVRAVASSGHKWVVLTDPAGRPQLVMDADGFLRSVLAERRLGNAYSFCHRPILVTNLEERLGRVLPRLEVSHGREDVIDRDVILLWAGTERRVITGADLLGRLLRGVARRRPAHAPAAAPGGAG